MCLEKPIWAPPHLSETEVSKMLPLSLKQSQCLSDWRRPSLVLSRKSLFPRFLFPRLSSPGHWWCDVLGFVPAGSVSSSSTLQIFREASHLWGLLCPPVYLLSRFLSLWHDQGSTPTGVFLRWMLTTDTCMQSGLTLICLCYYSIGKDVHWLLFIAQTSILFLSWNKILNRPSLQNNSSKQTCIPVLDPFSFTS